jgi:hypothetical protein
MGTTLSSLSPSGDVAREAQSTTDTLVLHCLKTPPQGYILLTPAIDSRKEGFELGSNLWNIELSEWERTQGGFQQIRDMTDGTFSVLDPSGRVYPVRGLTGPVEIYCCHRIECEEQPELQDLGIVVVVLGEEKKSVSRSRTQSFGNVIFRALLGEGTPTAAPTLSATRQVRILSFDDEGDVEIFTTSQYNVVVRC